MSLEVSIRWKAKSTVAVTALLVISIASCTNFRVNADDEAALLTYSIRCSLNGSSPYRK